MSRPLRIEFPGAVYHVTSRGDRREPIYKDDVDREGQLAVLAKALDRFNSEALAYCLMGNHYHLVLQTHSGQLSRLMRHLNGVYTQTFNRRHGLAGHLFQGRFKAVLVDRDSYFVEVCRYVERNPVAAGLVQQPQDWPWSSCRAHLGLQVAPPWLAVDELHGFMLGRSLANGRDRNTATRRYAALVQEHRTTDADFWSSNLLGQIYLGDEPFAERMRALATPGGRASPQVPAQQRKPAAVGPKIWAGWLMANGGDRQRALHAAYRAGWKTMPGLAAESNLSVAHVSRLIRDAEQGNEGQER